MQPPTENSDTLSTSSTTPIPEDLKAAGYEDKYYEPPPPDESKFSCVRYNEEQRNERRLQVWKLAVVDRKSQREIAKELGISMFTVHHDMKWVHKNRVQSLEQADKRFLVEHDRIYEALLDKWLPVALRRGNEDEEEAFMATDKVTTVLANQAKLHGFGAAGKVSAKEAGKEMGEYVLKAMQALASGQRVVKAEVIEEPRALEDKHGRL